MKFCDTHCHLDFGQFDDDREDVIKRAFDAGVVRIVNPGVDLETSHRAIRLAERYPQIWAAVGVHPHDADKLPTNWLETLEDLAHHPKVAAIGEIGLDFYRDLSPRDIQERVFREQIRLAKKLGLPMIIHIRQAHSAAREVLEDEGYFFGVLHAFSGDQKFLEWALERGFYVGFGGPITFKNYKKHHIVAGTPLEKILTETDSPYLSPHPFRGKRNEPANIPLIAEKIAEVKKITPAQVARQTTQNASQLFGFVSPYRRTGGRKSMGQNFLVNRGIAEKIADLAGEGALCVEIGPGRGILTELILPRFERLIAVELDESLASQLAGRFPDAMIIHQDILNFSLERVERYFGHRPVVCGNIPYSITSPIIFWIVDNRQHIARAVLMVQKEVAERLTASPGTKEYGIPTVLAGRYFEITRHFDVAPGSFSPPPKVVSSVITLTPRKTPLCPEIEHEKFSSLVKAAFSHRRKKLITNLRALSTQVNWQEILEKLGYNPNIRAEQLDIEDFCALTEFI